MNESIFIIAIIILGGLASLRGSLIGAVFLVLLPEFLRFVGFPDEDRRANAPSRVRLTSDIIDVVSSAGNGRGI